MNNNFNEMYPEFTHEIGNDENDIHRFNESLRWVECVQNEIAARSNQSVFAWGRGIDGQLGQGTTENIFFPYPIAALGQHKVVAIAAGSKLSLFLTDDGHVYQCGKVYNRSGAAAWTPEHVQLSEKVQSIAAGLQAVYAVTGSGKVFSWGVGKNGQLGHETHDHVRVPTQISCLRSHQVTKVATGLHFALALTATGKIVSWGKGKRGQLGHGSVDATAAPKVISTLASSFAIDICAGEDHALAIAVIGTVAGNQRTVYAWGHNRHGNIGMDPDMVQVQETPNEIQAFRGRYSERLAAGTEHSLVLCTAGLRSYVYSFGNNDYGQLGMEFIEETFVPRYVQELRGERLASIVAGGRSSFALTVSGEVYSWGNGVYGRTCQERHRTTIVPWKSKSLANKFVSILSAGTDHMLGLFLDAKSLNRRRQLPIAVPKVVLSAQYLKQGATCECSATRSSSSAPCNVFYHCTSCEVPLCRSCARNCHIGHRIGTQYQQHNVKCMCMDGKYHTLSTLAGISEM